MLFAFKGIGKKAKGLYYLLDMSQSKIQYYVAKFLGDTAVFLPKIKLNEDKQDLYRLCC